ncbi:right-handed parallel beta-helix repeat-containing protein [Kineosporia succinea]|uniref:Parallel beta helix pectate lyase-like protein n=1 Tax=Kineosporia succinea TaxID=84632 RepID=A0ABT9P4T3_9ACTN|nr:hypothetical protein [Kineosporia succinea]MDP9827692.1 hypothetical protein [Kineosporia succinea]
MLTRRNHRIAALGITVAAASAAVLAGPSHADVAPAASRAVQASGTVQASGNTQASGTVQSSSTVRAASESGRVIYVSPKGSDGVTRMSAATKPLASITKAIKLAQPGDTIIVRGGTYIGAAGYGASPGTADAPIQMQNAPGERVVIKGTLQLENADYWRVSGINVTRNPADGRKEFLVKFDGGTGWSFVNSEVWGTVGVSNVMVSSSSKNGVPKNYRISDNCIHDNNASGGAFMNFHNIYLMPGYTSGPGTIERNVMFNTENGAAIKAAGPSSSTGAANVTIRRNTITRSAAGVIIGYASRKVEVRNNLIAQQLINPPKGAQYVKNYNAAVIGNHVTGSGNKVVSTALSGFPKLINNTKDSSKPVKGALTKRITPKFSGAVSCSGFVPASTTAAKYGRWS